MTLTFPIKTPFRVGPDEYKDLTLKNSTFDPALCPPGKTNLTVIFPSNYDYWETVKQDYENTWKKRKGSKKSSLKNYPKFFREFRDKSK